MIRVLSVENMRKSDAYTIATKTPSKELMYRAGKGVVECVAWKAPVAVVAGHGNNAGDGYVIAELLTKSGIPCTVFLLSEKFSEDGKYYFDRCKEAGAEVRLWDPSAPLSQYAIVVDCILGTGFKGAVRSPAKEAIQAINRSGAYVVSVDINSGLDGDTGMAELCVHSDLTVAVGGFKTGHFLNMAKDVMKEKVNCPIGIEPVDRTYGLIDDGAVRHIFQPRKNFSNKGTYGYVALVGGSKKYGGAIRLATMANAAMRSGAGVVKVALPESLYHDLAPAILESTAFPLSDDGGEVKFDEGEVAELISNVKTVAFGMGVGTSKGAAQALEYLLGHFAGNLIVDADGLTLLSKLDQESVRTSRCRLVLTPHIKEFSRLTGLEKAEILQAPVESAERYARERGVILLLKGPTTIVTDGAETYLVDAGCAGMATAGSGDVLSGILSAVCSYGGDLLLSVAAAAYVNGKAGEAAQKKLGSISMIASDTVAHIPEVLAQLEGGKGQKAH